MVKKLLECKTYVEVAQYCKDNGFIFGNIDEYINALVDDIANNRKDSSMDEVVHKWEQEHEFVLAQREKGHRWVIGDNNHSVFLKGEDFEELQYSMRFHEKELNLLFGEDMEADTYRIYCINQNDPELISFNLHNILDINEIFDNRHELYEISNFRTTLEDIIADFENDNMFGIAKLLHERAKEIDEVMGKGVGYLIWDINNFSENIIFIEGNTIKELLTSICKHPEVIKYQTIKFEPIKAEEIQAEEPVFSM